jgi:hypothetical protein
MKKKTKVLNHLETNALLNAIYPEFNDDKKFKKQWRKIPLVKRIYYKLGSFYSLHLRKYFKKNACLMIPCIDDKIQNRNNTKFFKSTSLFLIKNKGFFQENDKLIKNLGNNTRIVFFIDENKGIIVGVKKFKNNGNHGNVLCGEHFNVYFSDLQYEKESNLYFREYYLTVDPEKNTGDFHFLLNCFAEIERKINTKFKR